MFRQRVWVAASAICIISTLYCDFATGWILSSGKIPEPVAIIDSKKIHRNQLKLDASRRPDPSEKLGVGIFPESEKPRINRNLRIDEFHTVNNFYRSGVNLNERELRGRTNDESKSRERKRYEKRTVQNTQAELPPNRVNFSARRSKQETTNLDSEKSNLRSSQLPNYEDDPTADEYEESTLISNVGRKFASTESKESSPFINSLDTSIEKGYFSVKEQSFKPKDKSSLAKNDEMVEGNGESQRLGTPEKKMQRYERFAEKEESQSNRADKGIDINESVDHVTVPTIGSARVLSVSNDERAVESFNDRNARVGSITNVKSGLDSVLDDQRKVKNTISLSSNPQERNRDEQLTRSMATSSSGDSTRIITDDYRRISRRAHRANSREGKSEPSGHSGKTNSDFQGAMKRGEKTKFNKKLPIGLSVINYTERSDPSIKRSLIPKYKMEKSYRRADVTRDMRREGDAVAKIPESVVREIGITDIDEIGLVPAVIVSSLDRNMDLIPHDPPRVIQLEPHDIRKSSSSRSIHGELSKTFDNEARPRQDISEGEHHDDLQVADERLSEISETISTKNFNSGKSKLKTLENRSNDSPEVIAGNDHVPRESLRGIVAVTSSRKEKKNIEIIETLNGGYLRSGKKKTWNEKGNRVERTTTLDIRATGNRENSSRHTDIIDRSKKSCCIEPRQRSTVVNSSELSGEKNISDWSKDVSLGTRITNLTGNVDDVDLEITRPLEKELLKTKPRWNSNDTRRFQFLVKHPGPIQDREIDRNENVGKATIDVRGKSSGDFLSDRRRDEKVIRNSDFIVQNSEKLRDKANINDGSLSGVEESKENIVFENTREDLTEKKIVIQLSHASPLFESNTNGKTPEDRDSNITTTLDKTAMTESDAQNGLRVDLLVGEKNDVGLRGGENPDGVSWTVGKVESNLMDKLWSGKPEEANLSTLHISEEGYLLTENHFQVDPQNNDRGKLSGKIVFRPKVVEKIGHLSKLKQRSLFPLKEPINPMMEIQNFLFAGVNDKYLPSKTKRAMGVKMFPRSAEETKENQPKTSFLPNSDDKLSPTRDLSTQKIPIAMNTSESSTVGGKIFSRRVDSILKSTGNNTRPFARSYFISPSEVEDTSINSGQSLRLFPENVNSRDSISAMGNLARTENPTETNVFRENQSLRFKGDHSATEDPGISVSSRTITADSNRTHSNYDDVNILSKKILDVSEPLNSDLIDQEVVSSFPKNLIPTEFPWKTTLDIFEGATQELNPSSSFNRTDLDNTSRVSTASNQWPVKHSAVVEGDLVLGGLMMVHEREDSVTCGPVMPQGGVQALEAMLYTLDRLNEEQIIPGVKIGAHILDDCDKDTYGLEMAVDFIKGSISNIDGAEYHCNKTAVRKVISGVVGAASSVTSIQVANLLRLFRIPQVSFFSTSPELSNKQRFEYFTRTIPSDHYQVKAMVDIVRRMNWSYVSIIYEESNYGIKAFEELEELLAKYDICIAIKEKLVKDSGVAEETAYDNIVQKLLTKPRARGCIIFGSDQEVAGVMRAVRRCNATGTFSWIGSDGWSARGLVSDGNEPEVEGTLSVQPQANPVKGFEKYFLDLTVENNRRNPWFVEFWEDHFQCRYPYASWTPYNQKYTKPCTTKERLSKQNTAFEDQLQFVSDAVTAFAYAFRDMHRELCYGKPGLCDAMKPTKGTELLKYLRKVDFEGLSGDKFRFDKNGDGPARYNIIHFKQESPGKYKWIRVGEYMEGELRLNMPEIQFRLGHPLPPESVCSLPCEVGQAKKYVEGESCCWHCFNCTQYQVRHPLDETQCIPCPQGRVPDETHSNCRDIPEEFLRPESGWAIGAMSFSATGILVTLFVGGVFLRHNDTPVVRASGRELSYVLLTGILLCYLVTFALVLRPNNIVCGIQRFGAGFCFTVVYAALLTKTNRISRIFNAGKQSAKRPSFISPRSQLIICSGLMGIQILINGVWMIIDPAKAMHHYPTRDDNLLICSSYIDASYMIAFTYPIILIVVCTVYAVLTRKIPEAFNESKHIGFTMYTTCVIWLAFVPLYFGTGNHVALRITSMSVTISLSASVTIACLFSPKLYIILIRPERNVRQSMMPARYSTTKSSAVTGTNASSMMAAVTLTAATCDQNKAVKRHVATTMDCSTQSEYYEMEVKEDRLNGKAPANLISRSTQTRITDSEAGEAEMETETTSSAPVYGGATVVVNTKDTTSKEVMKDSTTLQNAGKQLNNARIGNGPVGQKDGAL